MKKNTRNHILLSGIILLTFALSIGIAIGQNNNQTDDKIKDIVEDIKPYDGSIGPGSAMYGLKIGLENLQESFTFNERQKLEIQLMHSRDRIAEAKAELRNKNDDAANRAMDNFVEKIQSIDDRITGIDRNDTGLLEAQKEIVKHQFVLQRLLDDYPNNKGVLRAFNNSLELENKFESKTDRSVLPVISRDQVILRDTPREDLQGIRREVVQVEAKIVGNDTEAKVRVRFLSTSNDSYAISQEILNKLQLNKTEIDNVLEIQVVDFEIFNETLESKANAGRGITEVEAEFRFPLLKTTNRTDLLNGISQKLSLLTTDRILKSLDLRVSDQREIREINDSEVVDLRAKIAGNASKAIVKVKFVTDKTDQNEMAQEILGKLHLSKSSIDNLLQIEVSQREDMINSQIARISTGKIRDIRKEDRRVLEAERGGAGQVGEFRKEDSVVRAAPLRLKESEPGDSRGGEVQAGDNRNNAAEPGNVRIEDRINRNSEIGVGNNFSEVEFEIDFVLNTVDRSEIIDGIFQKLSAMTVQDVLNSVEKAKLEIKQKMEDRREQEIRHEVEAERGGVGEAERGGGSSSGGGSGGGR